MSADIRSIWLGGISGSPAAPVFLDLDPASATATAQSLTVIAPPPVVVNMDAASATASALALTVYIPPPVTVNLGTAAATISALTFTMSTVRHYLSATCDIQTRTPNARLAIDATFIATCAMQTDTSDPTVLLDDLIFSATCAMQTATSEPVASLSFAAATCALQTETSEPELYVYDPNAVYLNAIIGMQTRTSSPYLTFEEQPLPVVYVDGVDRSDLLIHVHRREEYCDPGKKCELTFSDSFSVLPWQEIVLFEYDTKTFTGTVNQIEENRLDRTMVVRGLDDIRRLREYFIAEDYETAGEGAVYWIRKFAEEAGCTIEFIENYDRAELAGMTIGKMMAYEAIDELLLYMGWDIWCDVDNVVQVGFRQRSSRATEHAIAGLNMVGMERTLDSESPRNACRVYTAQGNAYVHQEFGWEIDSDDIRTMVVASPYTTTQIDANELASRMLAAAGPTWDIKRIDLDDVYPSMEIAEICEYDNGEGDSGKDIITTVTTDWDGNSGLRTTHVVLGERCPKVGAGGANYYGDGRDIIVATYECGVWRCFDIWEDIPRWYPLNTGLEEHILYGEDDEDLGSSFKCEWFIRDPFRHLNVAFLLTQVGIYRTDSLEPGYENWQLQILNRTCGVYWGDSQDNYCWYIAKLRSTIASEGMYYVVVHNRCLKHTYVGVTKNRFETLHGGQTYPIFGKEPFGCYTIRGPGTYYVGPGYPEFYSSVLWGEECNFGYQMGTTTGSWHGGYVGYTGNDGRGGLAAWHRTDTGCSITGISSLSASNAQNHMWHAYTGEDPSTPVGQDPYPMIYITRSWHAMGSAWGCYLDGNSPLPQPKPYPWITENTSSINVQKVGYVPLAWWQVPTIHIPYDQVYYTTTDQVGTELTQPTVYWITPGRLEGTVAEITDAWPSLIEMGDMYEGQMRRAILLPWGTDPDLCPNMQGSIGTYTPNRYYVYAFSKGKPCRFGVSEDNAYTWEERESIPFETSCFSGFPRSENKVYAGRHPTKDPSTPGKPPDYTDTSLIYVSWDRGLSWHDVTGDLWDKTRALNLRQARDGSPLGTKGLVTIAPRY